LIHTYVISSAAALILIRQVYTFSLILTSVVTAIVDQLAMVAIVTRNTGTRVNSIERVRKTRATMLTVVLQTRGWLKKMAAIQIFKYGG